VLLATAQIEVCSYATAEAFLVEFDSSRPACVLLDVRLPGMTGLQLDTSKNVAVLAAN
jgi:two-component system response regulator FixJ